MPAPQVTLLIEGSFRELVEELADFIDTAKKPQGESTSLKSTVAPLLDKYSQAEERNDETGLDSARDEVLKAVVQNSGALNSVADKDLIPSYNLLIHLIHQSPSVKNYLQAICRNLSADFGSASQNRLGLALTVLSTIFNTCEPDDAIRYPVFNAVLDVISRGGSYENLRQQLPSLDNWLVQWQTSPQQQRRLYLRIGQLAKEAGEDQEAYDYLVRALRTIPTEDTSGEEAQKMSLEALKTALLSSSHYDFEDLNSLDSIQGLRSSHPVFYELLDIFTAEGLNEYTAFKEEHPGWLEEQELSDETLIRKIRLLTLTSLAASTGQTRSLPYATIADALQIPAEDVELWVIDVIRAGLVEGKLSQSSKTFLIHRSTYRVFGEKQWQEVAIRLDLWRRSLVGVLGVIQQEKANIAAQKEQELKAAESKMNGAGSGGFRRGPPRDRDQHQQHQQQQQQREPVETGFE